MTVNCKPQGMHRQCIKNFLSLSCKKPFKPTLILNYYRELSTCLVKSIPEVTFDVVKCNLTELTTKSASVPLEVSGLDTYAHVSEFHVLVDCSLAYRSVAYIQEAFYVS